MSTISTASNAQKMEYTAFSTIRKNDVINITSNTNYSRGPIIDKSTQINPRSLLPVVSKKITALDDLPFLNIILNNDRLNLALTLNDPKVEKSSTPETKSLATFLTIGHLYSSLQMTNLPQVDYQLTDYDKFYGGWEIGAGLSYDINTKNSIGSKLTYSAIKNESHFSQNINYLKGQEYTNTNGNILYDTGLEIASPTGNHSESITLDVTNENMQVGESLKNETNLYQNFNILSLSGYGNHKLFKLSDISFSVQAGIGLNLITSTSQEMHISIMHEDHQLMSKSVSNT